MARSGMVRQSEARFGKVRGAGKPASSTVVVGLIVVGRGMVGHGQVRQGWAGQCKAGFGGVWFGMARDPGQPGLSATVAGIKL